MWLDSKISAYCSPPEQNFCGNQGRVDEEIGVSQNVQGCLSTIPKNSGTHD